MMKSSKIDFYHLKYFFFLVILYIFIYNPPLAFLPFTPKYFLYSIIPFVIVLKGKLFLSYLRKVKYIFLLLILIIFYSFFREFLSSAIVFLPLQFSLIIEIIILPISLLILYKQIKPNSDFLGEIILIGTFASVITLILILIPSLNDYVTHSLLRTTEYTEFVEKRAFGFSEGLTFSYGTVQGLIFALVLFRVGENSKYYLLLPLFFIAVLFNARTGFTPIILALFLSTIYNFKIKKIVVFFIIFFIFSYIYNTTNLLYEYKETIDWGLDFFTQSSDFLSNKSSDENTLSVLLNNMAVFPDSTLEWIFGTGEDLFSNHSNPSDVGYIIQLYYGGLCYVFLILLIIISLIYSVKKIIPIYKNILFILIFCIIVFNIKGNLFTPVGILRTIMIIYIYILINSLHIKKKGMNIKRIKI